MISSRTNKIIIVILIIIFMFSLSQMVRVFFEYKEANTVYENVAEEFVKETVPAPAVLLAPIEVNIELLKNVNEEIRGWIYIDDSFINYPILQGEDNEKYLTHMYDGSYNKMGSIFLDYRCKDDFEGLNTIIYGHNMLTDDMFGRLEKYANIDYFQSHKYIYILLEDEVKKYEVFSAYSTDAYGETYRVRFDDNNLYLEFIKDMKSQSIYDTETEVTNEDKIVTLSTCTSRNIKDERFVVQAKEVFE